ncbi:MAG: hypothetical protein IPM38_13130 [Ignavibacteria bacterium]|nr:hypothetical protein [Ignavibacteria bacterium]
MPIEIKELHIKATVNDSKTSGGNGKTESSRNLQKMKSEILKECVEEVFQILKEREER